LNFRNCEKSPWVERNIMIPGHTTRNHLALYLMTLGSSSRRSLTWVAQSDPTLFAHICKRLSESFFANFGNPDWRENYLENKHEVTVERIVSMLSTS
jgi:hypothetical protein